MRVLHLAPHPDDELIGAPATLMTLRDSGSTVVNVACSLGPPPEHARRQREVREACRRAGFELVLPTRPIAMSGSAGDDFERAGSDLAGWIGQLLAEYSPEVVVSSSPHDRHPAHELVGRTVRKVLAERPPTRWWMWGLWADLPLPTILIRFGEARLREVLYALEAHEGELDRNDYRQLVRGRGMANKVLGAERVFGYGNDDRKGDPDDANGNSAYAELVTEVVHVDGRWRLGAAMVFNGEALHPPRAAELELGQDVSWWVGGRSISQRLADARLRD